MNDQINCPHCGQLLIVEASNRGFMVDCPCCAQAVLVPGIPPSPELDAITATPAAVTRPPSPLSALGKSKKTWLVAGAALLGVLVLAGLGMVLVPAMKASARANEKTQTIKAADGSIEMSVPLDWSSVTNLAPGAKIQMSDLEAKEFLLVRTDMKSDFPGVTLDQYSALARTGLAQAMTGAQESDRAEMQINGHRAIQYVVKGLHPGPPVKMDAAYLHTCTEDASQFYQILNWTQQSRFKSRREEMDRVIGSFKSRSIARATPVPSTPATVKKPVPPNKGPKRPWQPKRP